MEGSLFLDGGCEGSVTGTIVSPDLASRTPRVSSAVSAPLGASPASRHHSSATVTKIAAARTSVQALRELRKARPGTTIPAPLAREQHGLGVFERLGRTVDHHDVAILEFRVSRGLAAEDSLA